MRDLSDTSQSKFEIQKSPLRDAYRLLGARSPVQLSNLYVAEDQRMMATGGWDYNNSALIVNKVKTILEATDQNTLTPDEKDWREEILWFWYQHAINCAIWTHRDKAAAQEFSERALRHQSDDHPNKITKLLYYLTRDKVQEAEQWAGTIGEEVEKTTAAKLLDDYKAGLFFATNTST